VYRRDRGRNNCAGRYVHQLSGGMLEHVVDAMALVGDRTS
jgi:ABC-type dipeptide/oligopeptide/nickel transport system ATPase component